MAVSLRDFCHCRNRGKIRRLNKQNISIVGVAAAIFLLIAPLNAYAPKPPTPPKRSYRYDAYAAKI